MAPKNLIKGFKRPGKIIFEPDEVQNDYGRFIAEPFERGFGLTIGNCLRRVLLWGFLFLRAKSDEGVIILG